MEVDPTRVCELLVGLPAVTVLGVVDEPDAPIVVHVETRDVRPSRATCTSAAVIKDRPCVELVLPGVRSGWCGASAGVVPGRCVHDGVAD